MSNTNETAWDEYVISKNYEFEIDNNNLTQPMLNGTNGDQYDFGESGSILKHSMGWTIVLICAYVIICIVGTVGNGMVVCVLTFRPQMKSVTNMFIFNLACADLLVIIFCVAPTLLTNILIPWVLGPVMCKTVTYVQGVSVCASVYSLVAISLDRFLAIWFPTTMPRGLSKSQARVIILGIWIAAATIVSPWTVVFTLEQKDGYSYCVESWSSPLKSKLFFIVGNLILCYALPLFLVILGNGLIWLHVANRKVPESASQAEIKRVHKKTRHGVLRMLTVVTLTFLVSWLPLYVIFLISKLSDSLPETLEEMIPFAQILGTSNSALNPILYAFLNKKFRDAFKSLMACPNLMQGHNPNQTQTNATANSMSLNNSTMSMTPPQIVSYRQSRNTFRYPIVRV